MTSIERSKQVLLEVLSKVFSYDDFRLLCLELGVDFDVLRGEGVSAKARELLAYVERRGMEEELLRVFKELAEPGGWERLEALRMGLEGTVEVSRELGAIAITNIGAPTSASASDVDSLRVELAGLRQQLDEMRDGVVPGEQLEARIGEMVKTATRAIGRSEELRARLVLPPRDVTDVRLLPSNALERLEEYRTDENVVFLLIGAFGGAILGILSNWATNEPLVITRFSIVLMVLLGVLAGGCAWWAWRLRRRAERVKERMFCGEGAAGPEVVD